MIALFFSPVADERLAISELVINRRSCHLSSSRPSMSVAALLLAFPAFSPLHGVRPALSARHAVEPARVVPTMAVGAKQAPVPLTGQTLQASLKLRCDTTGAQYAIYWSNQGGQLKLIGYHAQTPSTKSYAEGSKEYTLAADGFGPIATVQRTQQPLFIPNVVSSDLKRKELAFKHGVSQVHERGHATTRATAPSITAHR